MSDRPLSDSVLSRNAKQSFLLSLGKWLVEQIGEHTRKRSHAARQLRFSRSFKFSSPVDRADDAKTHGVKTRITPRETGEQGPSSIA